ncbi:MAG: hypothetical protein MJ077_05400 [Oscillospiraceae bacterium]|nr:hypothetical protein [Oscillospiraceae bacterium]
MSYSPRDILQYVYEEKLESAFLSALMQNKGNYSIAELTDKVITQTEKGWRLLSKAYGIDIPVEDEGVIAARCNDLYVSAFLSRKDNTRQIHFLAHPYPRLLKSRFEEEIFQEVVQYMLLRTIVALRLDTPEKVRAYVG